MFNTKETSFSMSMHFCGQFATLYNSNIMFISLTFSNYYLSCPHTVITICEAMTYLRWSITSLTPWRSRFNSTMVFMGFVVGNGAGFFHSASVFLCQLSCYRCCALIFHQELAQYATWSPPLLQLTWNSVAAPTTQWIGYLHVPVSSIFNTEPQIFNIPFSDETKLSLTLNVITEL